MQINEIVEKLKYYTEDLPKEALKEAIKHKEEITPKLLEMLEYTKNNLEKIYFEEKVVDFIKSKEGLILTSKKYKGEKNYTIGYGHCQSDVKASQTITEEQAEEIFSFVNPRYLIIFHDI